MSVRNPPLPWPPRAPGLEAVFAAIDAEDYELARGLSLLLLNIDALDDLPCAFSKAVVGAALKAFGEGRIEHGMHMLSQTQP